MTETDQNRQAQRRKHGYASVIFDLDGTILDRSSTVPREVNLAALKLLCPMRYDIATRAPHNQASILSLSFSEQLCIMATPYSSWFNPPFAPQQDFFRWCQLKLLKHILLLHYVTAVMTPQQQRVLVSHVKLGLHRLVAVAYARWIRTC